MKPQEVELVSEISKLQCMVSELRVGFSHALSELGQIQHGDTFLRGELEENKRSCQKNAIRLEALVESLREELGVMQSQVLQLHGRSRAIPQQAGKDSAPKRTESDSELAGGRGGCDCGSARYSRLSRGKLLLHCFLQGLKAGLSEGTDARHQVAMQLLHSEWEYVSTLNQLADRYQKPPPLHHMTSEPLGTYVKHLEQLLQRHVLFRNTLQERLSAQHWKSLVGDILVQLIGQNDAAFSDLYVSYTTTLASLLSQEFLRLGQAEKSGPIQSDRMEREEMKLLSMLLAPVSRIHGYLSHIQSLLQWTGKEHPDCSLLLGIERALRSLLSRCHTILEEDVQWEENGGGQSCADSLDRRSSANCCTNAHQSGESNADAQRDEQQAPLTNGVDACHSLHLECWSCSPVRRKDAGRDWPCPDQLCRHACCRHLTVDTPCWGKNSDSGQGTGKDTMEPDGPQGSNSLDDCETDLEDTSTFDNSSITSCSPDAVQHRGGGRGREDEDEDSQVPVLLKPLFGQQQQRETSRERTVCVRWQIPRLTPHSPLRHSETSGMDGPKPCLVSSHGNRLVSLRKGSPSLHPNSAFRPIWEDPAKLANAAPERDSRQGFVPVQAQARHNFQTFSQTRDSLRTCPTQLRGNHVAASGSSALWEDSEDSEGPCSTV